MSILFTQNTFEVAEIYYVHVLSKLWDHGVFWRSHNVPFKVFFTFQDNPAKKLLVHGKFLLRVLRLEVAC